MPITPLWKNRFSSLIKEKSTELGFFACGISKAHYLPEEAGFMEEWLQKNMNGKMTYLERNREKRYDPSKLVEGAKSVITVLFNYKPTERIPENNNYKISAYAYGKDYHTVIKNKLGKLFSFIEEKSGKRKARAFVDSAPVLDRAWGHKSGLGFIGKNTCLINRKGGSYFFIGHLIIDLELEYESSEPEKNFCGSCTLCINACPTGALKPFELDARKCISYLTIEYRDKIPDRFKGKFNNWIFGCDICQEICPWNRGTPPHREPSFDPSEELRNMHIVDWKNIDKEKFNALFKESSVQRTGYEGLKRNIRYLDE